MSWQTALAILYLFGFVMFLGSSIRSTWLIGKREGASVPSRLGLAVICFFASFFWWLFTGWYIVSRVRSRFAR